MNIIKNDLKPRNLVEWAIMVKDIKGRRCVKCGKTTDLVSHHKKEVSKYPEQALDLENGVVMCRSCHSSHHRASKDNCFFIKKTITLPLKLWKTLRNLQTEGKIKSIQQAVVQGLGKVVNENKNSV